MKLKILLISTAFLAGAYLGDHYNVKDRLIEPVKYRNVKVDPKTCQQPFNLQKKYQLNKEGNLEVYIGYSDKWYKVDQDLRVNERNLGEKLKEETKEIVPYIKKKFEDMMKWYEENFKDGNRN